MSSLHEPGAKKQSFLPIVAALGITFAIVAAGVAVNYFGFRRSQAAQQPPANLGVSVQVVNAAGDPLARYPVTFMHASDSGFNTAGQATDDGGFVIQNFPKVGDLTIRAPGGDTEIQIPDLAAVAGDTAQYTIKVENPVAIEPK